MDEAEEIGNDRPGLVGINEAEDEILGDLIEHVEGEGKKDYDSHARDSMTAAQRSHNSG